MQRHGRLPDHPVVVITGASSGIGRASAHAFAARNARLVLAARDQAALEAAAAEVRALGAEAVVRRCDIAEDSSAESLARAAVDAFGRIDVWVNCAAVLMYGRFEGLPPAAFRRLIDTNVVGYANGARSALRQFRAQENRGTLINVGSMLGVVSEPYIAAYVTSKFAIRGLSASLRQEFQAVPDIAICTILPVAIDTPIYQKAANFYGRAGRSVIPVYAVERAARAIVRVCERPRAEVIVGSFGYLLKLAEKVAPRLTERILGRFGPPLQFGAEEIPSSSGNLHVSSGPQAPDGGWRRYWSDALRRMVTRRPSRSPD
jgi:short-subunit dehydrogenase